MDMDKINTKDFEELQATVVTARSDSYNKGVRDAIEAVRIAVTNQCACGGSGPNDEGACGACLTYHDVMGMLRKETA